MDTIERPSSASSQTTEEKQTEKEKTFPSNTANASTKNESTTSEECDSDDSSSYQSDATWPDVEIPGTWGTYGLEENPWNDETKPVVRLRNYEDLELTEDEENGVLTERIMACCSSYLDRSPHTGKYVLCKANLKEKNLQDISILTYHHYLQYLNLSYNQLTSLTPLGELPFLMYLDVSYNTLSEVLNFKAPFNLTYVNFSHNNVDVIDDLSAFWSLVSLDLSHNQIHYITGLHKLKYLQYLNLSNNLIRVLRNLNKMSLVRLDLQNNKIDKILVDEDSGLHALKNLIFIDLSNNRIQSLTLFENLHALQKIVMTDNKVKHLIELEHLKGLRYLTEVDFKNNPICLQKTYYEMCIKLIKAVMVLDGSYVSSEQKVLVKCKYDPPPVVDAAKKRANLLILEKLMKYEINDTTLPISKPVPPIMVLVGPPGCGQRTLLAEFSNKYKKYLKVGVSHTTRPMRESEVDDVDFHFIADDHFKHMIKEGEFLSVAEYMGYSYGFRRDELLKVYNEKMVLILHTDLISAITLRMKSLRPVLILTLCYEEEAQYEKLLKSMRFTNWNTYFGEMNTIRLSPTGASTSEEYGLPTYSLYVKELYEDVVSNMPGDHEKPAGMAKSSSAGSYESGDTTTTADSIGYHQDISSHVSSISERKHMSVSFHSQEKEEKEIRSISEHEMGYGAPILSALSAYVFGSDSESSTKTNIYKPYDEQAKFINKVIADRRQYVAFHQDNPGFFMDVVFTDKPEESMLKLKTILKNLVQKKKEVSYNYSYETDPCFEEMLTERLNMLYTEMYSEMSVSEDQQPKCWKEHTINDLES